MDQFQDQTLTCRDCGNSFVWTASEQKFYADKGFSNAPVRCPSCRAAKKAQGGGGFGGGMRAGASYGPRQMYDAVCSVCGKPCQVPFQPRLDESGNPVKPIYCNEHYRSQRTA
ncbi:zinc-binding protein [Candidatus Gottesmanbacteria bacterium RIFCSPHIGHO2_01_FULL_47_48]|uniref:Zinc-binding protein n=1 Tax=Candidatus Gottesmanbacteria bacterium RIFCSPHIGHO2_01_FULL_47_48 TaxID=1798381 RepID=A0A1F6A562_9BACT|nr:MAG: zinc-binding protein [Candidatus Gottesmanbacteria bacterium RIFCSPHIGHO2_01_FULL_47_48]